MEDLSSIGFQLGDGIKGLGMEEIKLVISKLAQFHAASAVYLERVTKQIHFKIKETN